MTVFMGLGVYDNSVYGTEALTFSMLYACISEDYDSLYGSGAYNSLYETGGYESLGGTGDYDSLCVGLHLPALGRHQ
jgi:hypothetical protein